MEIFQCFFHQTVNILTILNAFFCNKKLSKKYLVNLRFPDRPEPNTRGKYYVL
jgi:hypothetical protein